MNNELSWITSNQENTITVTDLFGFSDISESENFLVNGAYGCCGAYTPTCNDVYDPGCYGGGVPKGISPMMGIPAYSPSGGPSSSSGGK